jgi:hypothetical protein
MSINRIFLDWGGIGSRVPRNGVGVHRAWRRCDSCTRQVIYIARGIGMRHCLPAGFGPRFNDSIVRKSATTAMNGRRIEAVFRLGTGWQLPDLLAKHE